ncbi:hypothetical protein TNCV_2558311 [Trichonephila clavipes]|nr:hypothetical protein TNCV_2558311 [Trichonephila clavipes]
MGVHLHWLGQAADEARLLCGHAKMSGDFLLQCIGLDEHSTDDVVNRYWEARRLIIKKPSKDVWMNNNNIVDINSGCISISIIIVYIYSSTNYEIS